MPAGMPIERCCGSKMPAFRIKEVGTLENDTRGALMNVAVRCPHARGVCGRDSTRPFECGSKMPAFTTTTTRVKVVVAVRCQLSNDKNSETTNKDSATVTRTAKQSFGNGNKNGE